ncbi:hypothetical protein ACJX0J_013445, partial [Zea mays]
MGKSWIAYDRFIQLGFTAVSWPHMYDYDDSWLSMQFFMPEHPNTSCEILASIYNIIFDVMIHDSVNSTHHNAMKHVRFCFSASFFALVVSLWYFLLILYNLIF